MMLKSIFSSFLVLTLLSNLTFAQETSARKTHNVVETLPEVVITATRVEEALKDITQGVTVITKSDIEKKGVEFITDILRSQTDLGIVQNGGVGKNATLFLRGGSPNQTVFMIDGVKVKSPATGSLDISGIIVDDIERIEIIKGPQSTLYGSDAMAGVINIITKRGSGKPKLNISAEGGSFSTFKTDFSISGSKDISAGSILDYRFTATYFDTDGISAAKSGTENDGYTNKSFSSKIGLTPSERSRIEFNMRYYEDFSRLDGFQFGVGLVDDLNFFQRGKHFLISTKGIFFLLDIYEQTLTSSNISDNLTLEDPDTTSNNAAIDTMMQTIDWQHNLYLNGITLTAGAEYRREGAEDKGNLNKNINNKGLYLNGKVKLFHDSLIFNAGMRYDEHDIAGSKATFRTGV
ncbi:MAG: TonB-dependent receptor plug domain-containing protein, partial [Nitrospinota bacterium]